MATKTFRVISQCVLKVGKHVVPGDELSLDPEDPGDQKTIGLLGGAGRIVCLDELNDVDRKRVDKDFPKRTKDSSPAPAVAAAVNQPNPNVTR